MTAAAPTTNGFPVDARTAAGRYLDRGLCPIPLPPKSKVPTTEDWPNLRVTTRTVDQYFPDTFKGNIGVLNGGPSSNHVDVDLDCQEARTAAPYLLPATNMI